MTSVIVRPSDQSTRCFGDDSFQTFELAKLGGTPRLVPTIRIWDLVVEKHQDSFGV